MEALDGQWKWRKSSKKVLYVYDVERDIWFWYNPDQDLFYACDQMSEEQYALPTLMSTTAIIGTRNLPRSSGRITRTF